jgi:hypothetical protein
VNTTFAVILLLFVIHNGQILKNTYMQLTYMEEYMYIHIYSYIHINMNGCEIPCLDNACIGIKKISSDIK